ncbi:MAG TPA: hypothetical protein VND21_05390, partial [Planctomycetota bacterium]|nr:hypothetical protein [Planctomycetota bacterium]
GGGGGGDGPGDPGTPQALVIDVDSIEASGQFLLNGLPFPPNPLDAAEFRLRGGDGGTAILGATTAGTFSRPIVAGTYDVVYAATAPGAAAPLNPDIVVRAATDLTADLTFDPDAPTVAVTPVFLWNGGAFPANPADFGEFHLVPVLGGASVLIGRSDVAPVPVNVVPGLYDVEWRYVMGPTVPHNERAVILPGVPLFGNFVLPINVLSVNCVATLFLDGAPFPGAPGEQGRMLLRKPGLPDRVDLGTTNAGPALVQPVVAGVYDVVYTHEAGVVVPRNEDAVVAANVPINAVTPAFMVPVMTSSVGLQPTLNGGAFPGGTEQGDLWLRGATTADAFPVGSTNGPFPPIRVVRGNYDVLYRWVSGVVVPRNANAVVKPTIAVQVNLAVPVDVPTIALTPDFRLNGGGFPASLFDTATISLGGLTAGDVFPIGRTHLAETPVAIIAGNYAVLYDADAATVEVPLNRGKVLDPGVHLVAAQTLTVNVTGRRVDVALRLDGVPFPVGPGTAANILLEDPATKLRFLLMDSSASSLKPAMLIPGTYDSVYDALAEPTTVPNNHGSVVDTVTVL